MYATKRPKGVKARYADPADLEQFSLSTKSLTNKQAKFIELLGSGVERKEAAKQAGFTSSSSIHRCLTNPLAIQYLSAIRAESRAIAAYDCASAMADATDAAQFAREKNNPMALVRAYELKSKLAGLLIDRVEIATVDLTGALERAQQRLTVAAACTQQAQAEPQAPPNPAG
jgi:hypothetical protein